MMMPLSPDILAGRAGADTMKRIKAMVPAERAANAAAILAERSAQAPAELAAEISEAIECLQKIASGGRYAQAATADGLAVELGGWSRAFPRATKRIRRIVDRSLMLTVVAENV
jgi:hypothetical protein